MVIETPDTNETQTSLVVSPSGSIQQYISIEHSTITEDEALRLFFMYAHHAGFIDKIESSEQKKIAQCAFNFMIIMDEACRELMVPTRKFKTFSSARDFLREVSSLDEVVNWIKLDPQRLLHVKESGSEYDFRQLYQLSSNSQLIQIRNLKQFKQEVFDYKAWFTFAEHALKNMKKDSLTTMFATKKGVQTDGWNKRRFFFSFLLAMHYRMDIRPFHLDEIYRFVRVIQKDYNAWFESFKMKLKSLEDDNLAQMMLAHGGLKSILENLKRPQHQTVQYIASEVRLYSGSRDVLDGLESTVKSAVFIASQYQFNLYSPIPWGDAEKEMQECLDTLNRKLSELHPKKLAEVFSKNGWLISWLDRKNLTRLRLVSVDDFASNNDVIDKHADQEMLSEIDRLINVKFTLKDAIRDLWQIKSLPSESLRSFMLAKDDEYPADVPIGRWADPYIKRTITEIVASSFAGAPVKEMGRVVIRLYKEWKFVLPKRCLSKARWLALALVFGHDLPPYVFSYLKKEEWYKYISDDSANAWITQMVSTATVSSIRTRLPRDYKGDMQEILDSITGFTVAKL